MRDPRRARLTAGRLVGLVALVATACAEAPPDERAPRAFYGAPPVIPHEAFGAPCRSCHGSSAPEIRVDVRGTPPASPHDDTPGMGASRCRQCHVFQPDAGVFRPNGFVPLEPPALPSPRAHALAPPVTPHPRFMREDCVACHDGPGARVAIRTSHPERARCEQCHVPQTQDSPWTPS